MAGYDKSLDKELFSKSADFERTKITVSVHSYNEGTPKVQLSRTNKRADGEESWSKLGRLTKEELEAVLPMLEEAKGSL